MTGRFYRSAAAQPIAGSNKRCHERPIEDLEKALPQRSRPLFKRFWEISSGRWVSGKIVYNIFPLPAPTSRFRADSGSWWNCVRIETYQQWREKHR